MSNGTFLIINFVNILQHNVFFQPWRKVFWAAFLFCCEMCCVVVLCCVVLCYVLHLPHFSCHVVLYCIVFSCFVLCDVMWCDVFFYVMVQFRAVFRRVHAIAVPMWSTHSAVSCTLLLSLLQNLSRQNLNSNLLLTQILALTLITLLPLIQIQIQVLILLLLLLLPHCHVGLRNLFRTRMSPKVKTKRNLVTEKVYFSFYLDWIVFFVRRWISSCCHWSSVQSTI